jgi:aminomuconate-semialdehyde/2-hydroxymuconate-6-semialdehyde dehydrogenase
VKLYGQIPNSNKKDIDVAVLSAAESVPILVVLLQPAEKRFTILNKIAELIDENVDALALWQKQMTTENRLWLK